MCLGFLGGAVVKNPPVNTGDARGMSSVKCFNMFILFVRLDEAQARIKIAGRNINNLRYEDDTILMAESEEELKSLLMKVKEESEKAGLKLNIKKQGS